jgi:hypothetical protein
MRDDLMRIICGTVMTSVGASTGPPTDVFLRDGGRYAGVEDFTGQCWAAG